MKISLLPCHSKAAAVALATTLALSGVPAVSAFAATAQTASTDGAATLDASSGEYNAEEAVYFSFTDSAISTDDTENTSNYKIKGTSLTISSPGTYVLSGSCANGSVTVKKGTTGVTLVLNGLTLTNDNGTSSTAPITCNKSSAVTIIAASGTVNTLTDSTYNNDETCTENEDAENAVIKTKDGSQVTLAGSGTLNVVANGKNGIKSGVTTDEEGEAWLKIQDLTLNITANVNDALNAEQNLMIDSGTLTIAAADDAIHSDLYLTLGATGTAGPNITITSCYEGIEGAHIDVQSGTINLTATDDCLNAANSDLSEENASYPFTLNISGGTFRMYTSTGDGVDSNGTLTISGGTVEVWSASNADNQPLDADGTITISGGTVLAAGGSNGMGTKLASMQPYVTYGSSNTSGQPGQGDQDNQPGQNGQNDNQIGQMTTQNSTDTASTITLEASTDQPGGQGGGQPGGQPGGGQGGGQPGDQPGGGQGGDQPGGQGGSSLGISTGDTVTITDASGNTLYSTTAPCAAGFCLFSSGSVTTGSTYTLNVNGSSVGTATASTEGNQGNSGDQPGGDQPTPPSPTNSFSDVTDSTAWYYECVNRVASLNLMTGYDDGTFGPEDKLTRAQAAVILWRYFDPTDSAAYDSFMNSTANTTGMSDVEAGTWYTGAANWAVANGVISGKTTADGTTYFDPDGEATREQLCQIIANAATQLKNIDVSGCESSISTLPDGNTTASWATEGVGWALSKGIISGFESTDGTRTLAPQVCVTRAQMAAMLVNIVDNSVL